MTQQYHPSVAVVACLLVLDWSGWLSLLLGSDFEFDSELGFRSPSHSFDFAMLDFKEKFKEKEEEEKEDVMPCSHLHLEPLGLVQLLLIRFTT